MGADEPLAVDRHGATAQVIRVGPDHAVFKSRDEGHGLDDGAGQDLRVEDVGTRLTALAGVVQAANEESRTR